MNRCGANGSPARIDTGNGLSSRYYYYALDTGNTFGTTSYGRLRQTCVLTTTLGDCADDMRSGSNRTLDNMPYWYDNAGNVLVMGERTPGFNGVQTYSYDALDY